MILAIAFFIISVCQFFAFKVRNNGHKKFSEFYTGLKKKRISKLYSIFLLLRRLLLVCLFLYGQSLYFMIHVCCLCSVQFMYLVQIAITRPFEFKHNNLIEIINEVYFWFACMLLLYYNK